MLHFAKQTGGVSPINDDAGSSGVPIFDLFKFDSTSGGSGQVNQMALFLFNDDSNYQFNAPEISLSGSDPVEQKSWFTFLDNANVAGLVPTQAEWLTYGVAGTGTMTVADVGKLGSTPPEPPSERKIWIRCSVPAGIATANLTGLKVKISAEQEAV